MSATGDSLFDDALALPPKRRAQLAERLIDSLDSSSTEEIDASWVEEIERRLKAFEEGRMKAIPASEVFAEIRARKKQ
jgi:putative addiction module component (TIGR02574 family)